MSSYIEKLYIERNKKLMEALIKIKKILDTFTFRVIIEND